MEYATVMGPERFFDRSFTLKEALGWGGVLLVLLVLGAHYYRAGNVPALAGVVGALAFHCSAKPWKKYVVGLFLAWGVLEWGATAHALVQLRQSMGIPWLRGALIIYAVAALTAVAALRTLTGAANASGAVRDADGGEEGQTGGETGRQAGAATGREAGAATGGRTVGITDEESGAGTAGAAGRWARSGEPVLAQVAAFALVFASLYALRLQKPNILLLEHFFPLWGSVQIFLLAWYAAFLVEKLGSPKTGLKTRRIAWFLFTVVYFGQIALGAAGVLPVAPSGNTHVPVPAFIVFSPLYRGTFTMMPILVLAATLLAGSAWCSMLCYFGSVESLAGYGKRVTKAPEWFGFALRYGRWAVLAVGAAMALGLRFMQAPAGLIAVLVTGFALVSLGIMLVLSRRYTGMVHCTAFCPMGLVINLLSKLSPWRVKIDAKRCTGCGACEKACGYRAISAEHRQKGRPALTCSMCRDCVGVCPHKAIQIKLPFVSAAASGQVFTVMVVALHVLFIAAARPM